VLYTAAAAAEVTCLYAGNCSAAAAHVDCTARKALLFQYASPYVCCCYVWELLLLR
jgi:hypothetical protein